MSKYVVLRYNQFYFLVFFFLPLLLFSFSFCINSPLDSVFWFSFRLKEERIEIWSVATKSSIEFYAALNYHRFPKATNAAYCSQDFILFIFIQKKKNIYIFILINFMILLLLLLYRYYISLILFYYSKLMMYVLSLYVIICVVTVVLLFKFKLKCYPYFFIIILFYFWILLLNCVYRWPNEIIAI